MQGGTHAQSDELRVCDATGTHFEVRQGAFTWQMARDAEEPEKKVNDDTYFGYFAAITSLEELVCFFLGLVCELVLCENGRRAQFSGCMLTRNLTARHYSKLPSISSRCRPQDGSETDIADIIGGATIL